MYKNSDLILTMDRRGPVRAHSLTARGSYCNFSARAGATKTDPHVGISHAIAVRETCRLTIPYHLHLTTFRSSGGRGGRSSSASNGRREDWKFPGARKRVRAVRRCDSQTNSPPPRRPLATTLLGKPRNRQRRCFRTRAETHIHAATRPVAVA